jgi:hypothetical protein
MPRPNRRGPARRQAGYSNRPAAGGRRGNGYGNRNAGASNAPMFAILGGVGAVLVIVLVIILASGGDPDPVDNTPDVADRDTQSTKPSGPAPVVLQPFTEAQKKQILEMIDRLDPEYAEAKELKDEGFRHHNVQDYEEAQAAWKKADVILVRISGEAEMLMANYGDDAYDRLERFIPRAYHAIGKWDRLKAEYKKYLK